MLIWEIPLDSISVKETVPEPIENLQEKVQEYSKSCTVCGQVDLADVRSHYKSDWHNYNIKRKLRHQNPLNEDDFDKKIETCSLSSVDGSDDEQQEEKSVAGSPFYGFQVENQLLLVHKQIFHAKQRNSELELPGLITRLAELQSKGKTWILVMLGSGHFAAAVFSLDTRLPIVQKSFHRYTTRRKQGGAQSGNDNAKGKAKSAGASIRRYNEMALKVDIRELLISWKDHFKAADLVFIRAPPTQQSCLYVEPAILNSKDSRIRSFPFTTKRPTFTEITKSFNELITVKVREVTETREAVVVQVTSEPVVEEEEVVVEVDPLASLVELCKKGKKKQFCYNLMKSEFNVNTEIPDLVSFLFISSQKGHSDIVEWLLLKGADPTATRLNQKPYEVALNKETRNAFRRFMAKEPTKWDYSQTSIPSALTVEMERKQQEKQLLKKTKYLEKLKQKQEEQEEKEQQEHEQRLKDLTQKFVISKLSSKEIESMRMTPETRARLDREKRAIAAEARIRTSQGKCAACAKDIQGLVPFEKFNFKYCSMACVSRHYLLND